MVPGKTDPRWKQIVTGNKEYNFSGLATKMLMMRVKMITKTDQSPAKVQEAIDIAHDFFMKNENIVKDDIKLLFG